MKFRFIWIGKTKDKNYRTLQEEYLQRLSHFVKCEVVEIRDSAPHEGKETEGKRILEKLNQSSFVCLLDVTGRSLSSPELSKEVEKWQNAGTKEISFIIGGAEGIAPQVAARADTVLSLSFLTFTHEMARVVMLEQLYRAYTIIKGFPYQK
ncbi:MAG: 23S rRNA (pseudouridine(1915)-N(3))-methyltransferase RlmH [Pyrinomonadaceae bacterium]